MSKNANKMQDKKLPIINCHAHIFTGDHVAPLLARSIIVAPLYRLINFKWVFAIFRWYYQKGPGKARNTGAANDKRIRKYNRSMRIERNPFFKWALKLIGIYFTIQVIDFLLHWTFSGKLHGWMHDYFGSIHAFVLRFHLVLDMKSIWVNLLIMLLVVLFFKSGRNLIWFVLKNMFSILGKLPGKQTRELFERYLTIGRFTFHQNQSTTLKQLQSQYPKGTGFVILPMDMEFMDAGKPAEPYAKQMENLAKLKAKTPIYPFVFVDPRRIAADDKFFRYYYDRESGQVVLRDCFIKTYIEDLRFSGFKIYPALGYYPFDFRLLPLWKYAEQKQLPIMTHCVRGPIFFRGPKVSEWDNHPVFTQSTATGSSRPPLLLPQTKNAAFTANFTHPMNYACLLKKEFLAHVVHEACKKPGADKSIADMFGLGSVKDANGKEEPVILKGLENLKLCLGHYGGNDEWKRYFEQDRSTHSNELAQTPNRGIDFLFLKNSTFPSPGKPEQLWKFTDWYSIISSLILQHPNVYADISFILHDDAQILPLLKQSLQNPGLRSKILFGTDFYVVRNNKSDKNMLADIMGGLSEDDFDQIARLNPRTFLAPHAIG